MARQPRIQAPGIIQHLLARGIEGRSIFKDDSDYRGFIGRLGNILQSCLMECYAWCLMPNHLHLLVRPGETTISKMMARLLTGYAINYNKRYDRVGYLFQNRFKSLVCTDEKYFLELVRYIHLNPLRAGMVESVDALARYPWSGHGVVLGYIDNAWYDGSSVLEVFHRDICQARQAYLDFIRAGSGLENHPLKNGTKCRVITGSVRGEKNGTHRQGVSELSQEDPGGVTRSEIVVRTRPGRIQRRASLYSLAKKVAKSFGITSDQLKNRTRNPVMVRARSRYAFLAVQKYGYQKVEVARYLGQTVSAVEKNIQRTSKYPPEMVE